MRLLIDENISPQVVRWLAQYDHVFAQHAAHVGLAGQPDPEVWQYAWEHDQIVVTNNVGDFLTLARDAELHPGIIALRESGLRAEEQYARIRDALSRVGADFTNRVLDIRNPGEMEILTIPPGHEV
jgi:predicted nuclease of predicted toxin-antitoxin system